MTCMVRSILSAEEEVQWSMERFKKLLRFLTAWRDAGRMKEHHFPRWSQILSLPRSETGAIKQSCHPALLALPRYISALPGSRGGLVYMPSCRLNSMQLPGGEELPASKSSAARRASEACKECRTPSERVWFQCGQRKLAGDRDKLGFMLYQEEVFTMSGSPMPVEGQEQSLNQPGCRGSWRTL